MKRIFHQEDLKVINLHLSNNIALNCMTNFNNIMTDFTRKNGQIDNLCGRY